MQPCDIQHGQTGIAAQLVGIPGVDVGAALDEQFDLVQGEEIGCGRVHERGATEGIDGVDVRAVIEQQADAVHVAQHRSARSAPGNSLAGLGFWRPGGWCIASSGRRYPARVPVRLPHS
jgi:hypothetical protein